MAYISYNKTYIPYNKSYSMKNKLPLSYPLPLSRNMEDLKPIGAMAFLGHLPLPEFKARLDDIR